MWFWYELPNLTRENDQCMLKVMFTNVELLYKLVWSKISIRKRKLKHDKKARMPKFEYNL